MSTDTKIARQFAKQQIQIMQDERKFATSDDN